MSMLVGVRGQTRESEGAALREGIIQQPGPFYNGNPSSIIWGNSPTAALWRDESASPLSPSASSDFDISEHPPQKEEKDKFGAGMVAGEGRASSKGRRHVVRTQFTRNPNPNPLSSPSSPFAFGFPSQAPPASASTSVPQFGQTRVPPAVPSGSSFMAFGSNANHATGDSATGINVSVARPGVIPIVQDERMEDIEEVTPAVANLSIKDHPKVSVKAGEYVTSAGVGKEASIRVGYDVGGKLSGQGLNCASESQTDRKDAAGVFVFGAKPSSYVLASAPPNPPVAQAPVTRSRTVKVKRIASAAKGKGIAAGNGAFGAPSLKGLHTEGSQTVTGECSFSQPNLGLGIPLAPNAECTSDDSSSQGFASSTSLPNLLHEDSVPEGLHHSSPDEAHSPSEKGQHNFFFSEIGRGSQSSGESNARSEPSFLSELSFKSKEFEETSTVSHNVLLRSAFTRVVNNKGSLGGSFSSTPSLEASFAGLDVTDNSSKKNSWKPEAPGQNDMKASLHSGEDLSSALALKLSLGSAGSVFDKEVTADSTVVGKPSVLFNTEAAGSSENVTSTPNLVSHDAKATGVKEDGDTSSSSSPTNTVDFLRMAKETSVDAQKPSFHGLSHVQAEAFTAQAQNETFLFGASGPQFTTTRPEASHPFPFTFTSKTCPSFSSVSSSTGGGCVSKGESKAVSDSLPFKQKSSDAYDSSLPSQDDTNAVTTSFSYFNLGGTNLPVKEDSGFNVQGDLPGLKMPTTATPFTSGPNVRNDSDGECSSYVTAASHFVFSAGSSSPSSSQATAPMGAAPKGNGSTSAPAPHNVDKDKFVSTSSFPTSEHVDSQFRSQPNTSNTKSFEFRASSGDSGGTGKLNTPRKKGNRTQLSGPRRHSRSSAAVKENKKSGTFNSFVDTSVAPDEAGSPMDFSPQRYTPPDESLPDLEHIAKQTSWSHSQSMEKEGLDGDDEWARYSETDVAMENLRNAASDLTLGSKPGGQDAWEGIEKGEEESFWWGGKENSHGKVSGRSGKWKRAAFDEKQVPLSGRDNTWADIKLQTTNEHESAASSSTPSVDSSASSTGWGHFTFTAGSSPKSSSATLLKRHARRIQRDKPSLGFSEAMKSTSSKVRGEGISSERPGVHQGVGVSVSATGGTKMKRPVFAFDAQTNNSEPGKGLAGRGGNWASEQPKAASNVFSSRSNSWSTESSLSMGSLPRADGVGPSSPQTAGAAATEQVCERWRLRGNQAYANGDFPKAEEYYSLGASSVPPNETSQSCIRASMLCYSNRAATRMVVGRMREALADCMRAMAVDPNFLRVRLRAASCHLALGEIGPAVLAFKECIRRAKEDDQPDAKVSSEASEGLRKSLQVEEYLERASEILANWSSGDTPTALRLLNEALLSSPHSERALELKSRALLMLRRYDEVVQLCEQSWITAERNHPLTSTDHNLQTNSVGDAVKHPGAVSHLKVWRWQLMSKAKYHLGRLEEALELLQKDEITLDKTTPTGPSPTADPMPLLSISSIRDLLRHKAAGNEAFQNGKHAEAVEHYTAALACNGDSRPFNAVCFCNRAAASQALGNIADAIADCSRAIALDPKYAKAISRRATLHEKVRDYSQSCHDLQRLITLLESQQTAAKVILSPGRAGRSSANSQQDLRQARDRLAKAEEEMKKGHPLDQYMILGVESGCSSNEVKKAYRKAALRHHPDKAGQFLARNEGGDDGGLWKEVGDEVRRDAERLFKLIGEANAILSDTQRRTRYDAEEEFRKLRTRTGSATGGLSEMYRSAERGQGEVGRRPRDRWDKWNGYSHQHQRWQSGPDAAQPDTYARRGRYGSNNSSRSNGDGGRWNDYDWDEM